MPLISKLNPPDDLVRLTFVTTVAQAACYMGAQSIYPSDLGGQENNQTLITLQIQNDYPAKNIW